ncbi:Uma2 family endonuclease [Thermus tengchongensis]|uniref:Uma2 family endonuclease n=1 Tax=Thermus tengchongensis TaxID=1214928 RepID=UPI000570BB75|nr:Uma2 family endonuclease [Thermus tengchongensis]
MAEPSGKALSLEAYLQLEEQSPIRSESTEDLDRGKKLWHYLRLPSLRAYLLLDSRRVGLEAYLREGGRWTYLRLGPGESLPLPCPSLELAVDEVYQGVNLEEG